MKDKIQDQREGWQAQTLMKAGKATLIQSFIQDVPIYIFSTFRVPYILCNSLDGLVRRFWWTNSTSGKGKAWKKWSKICKPKHLDGLGFKSFKDINMSLVAKLEWKVAVGNKTLL